MKGKGGKQPRTPMDGWMDGSMKNNRMGHNTTQTARTEAAKVLDGLDVRAEEALHAGVHHLDGHLVA